MKCFFEIIILNRKNFPLTSYDAHDAYLFQVEIWNLNFFSIDENSLSRYVTGKERSSRRNRRLPREQFLFKNVKKRCVRQLEVSKISEFHIYHTCGLECKKKKPECVGFINEKFLSNSSYLQLMQTIFIKIGVTESIISVSNTCQLLKVVRK